MIRILSAIFSLLSFSSILNGQSLRIKNDFDIRFEKIVVIKERDAGRHTYPFDKKNRGIEYASPVLVKDTLNYTRKIKFEETGKYTFIFLSTEKDSEYYLFGIDLNQTKKVSLSSQNAILGKKDKEPVNLTKEIRRVVSDFGMVVEERIGRADIFFNFINKTNYTIYAIYPWLSDEYVQRGTVLYHNPDRKILPMEQRMIAVIQDRNMDSFYRQKITFKMVAIDSESRLICFTVRDIELSAEDVVIDQKSIELDSLN